MYTIVFGVLCPVLFFAVFFASMWFMNRRAGSPDSSEARPWDKAGETASDARTATTNAGFSLDVALRYIPLLLLIVFLRHARTAAFVIPLLFWGGAHLYLAHLWSEGLRSRQEPGKQLCLQVFRVQVLTSLCLLTGIAKHVSSGQLALVGLALFGMHVPGYTLLASPRAATLFDQHPASSPVLLSLFRQTLLWVILGSSVIVATAFVVSPP